jgi:hypothetical protein
MSHEPSHTTEHLPAPEAQSDERIATGKIIAVGLASLVVFAGATYWSWKLMDRELRLLQPTGPAAPPKEIGKAEIGIVDQVPFEIARSSVRTRKQQEEWLNSYGWIDPAKGTIHVPIDRAMEAWLAQEKGKKP